MNEALRLEPQVEQLARDSKSLTCYLDRGTSYPIALEGALKLKNLYIHAEGYGRRVNKPIADRDHAGDRSRPMTGVEKTVSNMQEVAARGGKIILLTDPKGAAEATVDSLVTLTLPEMSATVTPLVYAVLVQLIAYHTAVMIGTDVDQPRNLAKSVTVE